MTRGQRTAHRTAWLALAPLLLLLVALAVFTRSDPSVDHAPSRPSVETGR